MYSWSKLTTFGVYMLSIICLEFSVLINILDLNTMNLVKVSCLKYLNTNVQNIVGSSYHPSPFVIDESLKVTQSLQRAFPRLGRKTLAAA